MDKGKLSIIIPSRGEQFMPQTVNDIFKKAKEDFEIIVILDGVWPAAFPVDRPNLVYVHRGESQGMRAAINSGASICHGEYLLKCDAHVMFDEGFDVKLKSDCEDNCVVIPRRYRLDAENWAILENGKPPEDYQYWIYPRKYNPMSLHGYRWDERTLARKDVLIDDTLTFQGSCWFMRAEHFRRHGFLAIDGYEGLPQQEAEEIGLTTWLNGGRVVVNKKTWYAHLHKPKRGYAIPKEKAERCYEFSYNHWVHGHKDGFVELIEKFWPIPNWPENWAERIYR